MIFLAQPHFSLEEKEVFSIEIYSKTPFSFLFSAPQSQRARADFIPMFNNHTGRRGYNFATGKTQQSIVNVLSKGCDFYFFLQLEPLAACF